MSKTIIAIVLLSLSGAVFAEPASCEQIISYKDDFTEKVTFRSPFTTRVNITKVKNKQNSISYFLYLTTIGHTPVVDGRGVSILFEGGKKLSKSENIDVEATEKGFEYSAFIPLNKGDLNLLKSKKILKFKLYVFQQTLSDSDGDEIMHDVNCIINL